MSGTSLEARLVDHREEAVERGRQGYVQSVGWIERWVQGASLAIGPSRGS
jgi:hypothetical protein